MSVYIEGIGMPEDGRYTLCITHDSSGNVHWVFQNEDTYEFLKHGRVKELPPHGDLIYREALTAAICSRLCIKDLTYLSPAEKAIVNEINDAPVVIPASADDVNDFTVAEEETLQLTNRGKMCEVFGEKDTYEMFAPAGWWDKIYMKPAEEGET